MTPSKSTTAPARGSRTAAASAATSSGSPVTRTRRTVAVAAAHRRHERDLVAGRDRRVRVGVLAVDRGDARARRELHAPPAGRRRSPRSGSSTSTRVGARALAQAGEETDGDEHARRVRCEVMEAELTHLDATGTARMVDVSAKRGHRALRARPRRRAHVARGRRRAWRAATTRRATSPRSRASPPSRPPSAPTS